MSKKNRDGDNEDKKSVKRQERSAPITRSIKKVGKKAAAIVADRLRADLIVEANEVTGNDQPMVQETIGPATERGLTEGPLNPAANVMTAREISAPPNWSTACSCGLGRPASSQCRLLTSPQSGGCSFICCAVLQKSTEFHFPKIEANRSLPAWQER